MTPAFPRIGSLTLLALMAFGCATNPRVPRPSSDATPPAIVWNVLNRETGAAQDHAGSPTVTINARDTYRITLKAYDPEGVQLIELNPAGGGTSWQCRGAPPENPTSSHNATINPQTQTLSPDANGMVLTGIVLIVDVAAFVCPPTRSFFAGSGSLTGRARNYFGGTSTGVLTLNVTP